MSNLFVRVSKSVTKLVLPHHVRHAIRKRFSAKSLSQPPACPPLWVDRLQPEKLDLIDVAVRQFAPQSFADLGGVWNVDGGYSFYALERHGVPRGTLVDFTITDAVRDRQKFHPGLRPLTGSFSDPAVVRQVGRVDMVMLFYVLLHQVDPDWDAVLRMYAPQTSYFLIVNPQYQLNKTLRLIDCGPTEYFRHVPHAPDEPDYRLAFTDLDAMDPIVNKPYRTSPTIWQWGITDDDLTAVMKSVGFRLEYYQTGKQWPMAHVRSNAFLFRKVRDE
jgi:hypothetical protein